MIVRETNKYRIEKESGLIDGCKYMLYFKNGWHNDGYHSVPVRTIKEAMSWVNGAVFDKDFVIAREFMEEELIAFIDNYTIGDELTYDTFTEEQKDFLEDYYQEMKKKIIKLIEQDSLAFKRFIRNK